MGFVSEITQLIQGVIVPDLKAIQTSLDALEKDIDYLMKENDDLTGKYGELRERLAKLEGLFAGLEPALKVHVENLILKALSPAPKV